VIEHQKSDGRIIKDSSEPVFNVAQLLLCRSQFSEVFCDSHCHSNAVVFKQRGRDERGYFLTISTAYQNFVIPVRTKFHECFGAGAYFLHTGEDVEFVEALLNDLLTFVARHSKECVINL